MLNNEDRTAIEGLFQRLREVERTAEPRDAEAERLIRDEIARQPAAPYYLAQTVLVQEHALQIAERRISELEGRARRDERLPTPRPDEARSRGPWDRDDRHDNRYAEDRRGGGGFLAGAAQTALGVAGGVLIGHAIASMFGGDTAHAAEAPQDQPVEPDASDGGAADAGGSDDFGGVDDGGFDDGGFDLGGDF